MLVHLRPLKSGARLALTARLSPDQARFTRLTAAQGSRPKRWAVWIRLQASPARPWHKPSPQPSSLGAAAASTLGSGLMRAGGQHTLRPSGVKSRASQQASGHQVSCWRLQRDWCQLTWIPTQRAKCRFPLGAAPASDSDQTPCGWPSVLRVVKPLGLGPQQPPEATGGMRFPGGTQT